MITILEKQTRKLPGFTSMFIQFETYNADAIKQLKEINSVRDYNPKTKEWEFPICVLSQVLDTLCIYDDIQLEVEKDKKRKELKTFEIGPFKTQPFDYQLEGIQRGLNWDKWLLLDAPGLGKSLQMIYLAQEIKKRDNIQHCLIVCGINSLKGNWKREILKHSDLPCRIIGEKITKTGKIKTATLKERVEELSNPIEEFFVIINIESIRNKDIIKELNNENVNKYEMIVFDEAHKAKSNTSQQGQNFLKLDKAKYKIALTGTLLLNSPLDAYMPLCWIGMERSTATNFEYYYCNYTGHFNDKLIGYKNIDTMKMQLDECSLRRTKDLLDLPEKNIINEYVDMSDKQAQFYEDICNKVFDDVDKIENISRTIVKAKFIRLRQATSSPSILSTLDIPSAKIERAVDLANQITSNGEKVVIYSVFKETLYRLQQELERYNPLVCTGDIKEQEIQASIDKFQEDKNCQVMLCTTQKMGTGFTLTAANNAIFIDCPWTAGECEQCEDRLHRIGSTKPVFIYYLWTTNTVDERVKEVVSDKELISDYVIDGEIPARLINRLKDIFTDMVTKHNLTKEQK